MTVYYAIVEDDPLDNDGNSRVVGGAAHSTIEGPDGRERKQAHLGTEAWCAVCQSFGLIVSGSGIREGLRGWDERFQAFDAVSGDIVICKCPSHPRVIARYGRNCEYIDIGGASISTSWPPYAAAHSGNYDEQFLIKDSTGQPMSGLRYRMWSGSNVVANGVTDSSGRTVRIVTGDSKQLRLEIAH